MTRMIPTVEAQSAFQVNIKKTYGNSLKDGEGSASPPTAQIKNREVARRRIPGKTPAFQFL